MGMCVFVASHFYSYLAVYFTRFEDELVRNGIAIAILFIATLIVGAIVNYVISSLVENRVVGHRSGAGHLLRRAARSIDRRGDPVLPGYLYWLFTECRLETVAAHSPVQLRHQVVL